MTKDQTHPGQAQSAKAIRRRTQARRKRWYALVGFFCVLAVMILLATNADFAAPWFSAASSEDKEISSANSEATHTGTIVVQSGEIRCERAKFDNDTGRITNSSTCESEVVLDAHGRPVPVATVRRLDTISKSFSGR
jgi:hypothetical protein